MSLKIIETFNKNSCFQAVLVKKKSRLDVYKEKFGNNYIQKLLSENNPSIRSIKISHNIHQKTVNYIENILKQYNFSVQKIFRSQLNEVNLTNCLVLSVGGDGTVLDVSHFLKKTPLLGINSDPERSIGALCAASKENFEIFLKRILSGNISIKSLLRIHTVLNGKKLPLFALNEILIADKNPAATSRYILKFKDIKEDQMSSGIWVATPSGSTGAIVSAGGKVQSFNDKRLQIMIREPYMLKGKKYKIFSKFLEKSESIEIISKMTNGQIFFDGPERVLNFPFGSHLKVDGLAEPFKLFVSEKMEKKRIEIGFLRQSYINHMYCV